MTDIRHLIQDLRAEAPNASPGHGQLMRDAAIYLQRICDAEDAMTDREVRRIQIHPPRGRRERHHQVKGAICD